MIPASLQQGLTGFELAAQLNRASSIELSLADAGHTGNKMPPATVWTDVGAVGV